MITFSVLMTILLVIAIVVGFIAVVFGASFIAIFGDLIVCILIIWALVKLFRRKK